MPQAPDITIPATIDGLEQALEEVISGKDWAMDDLRRTLRRIRIHNEYFRELKERPNQSEAIKAELSQKYFNTPNRITAIEYILYKYPKKQD